jgi:hypothetical protein
MDTGIIDGIKTFTPGTFLVLHWEGRIYLVNSGGHSNKILELSSEGANTADFEYIPRMKLLLIPSFRANRIIAYSVQ